MNTKKDIQTMNKLRFSICWIEFCSMPVIGCDLVLMFMFQFGLAGRWIKLPKDRGFAKQIIAFWSAKG